MRAFYLIAAAIGTILPYYYIGSFVMENGFDIRFFINEMISTRASLAITIDVFISSFAFWPFLFKEAKRLNTPNPWLFVFLNLAVGLSCALPLFLYFRDKNESKERNRTYA